MANILVINPYVIDFKLYDEWMHPMGLYFLITALKKNGHTIYYYNCLEQSDTSPSRKYSTGRFDSIEIEKPQLYGTINRKYKRYGRPQSELRDYLLSIPEPDLICVGSMMTYWAYGVVETVNFVREVFPDTPTAIGGIAAQLIPDFFKSHIDNCTVAGSIFTNSYDTLPITAPVTGYDSLIPAISYSKRPHGALLLSLGCPLLCSYCASRMLQPSFIQRPVETVLSELEYFVTQKNVTDLAFCDDALLYKPENTLMPILDFIHDRKLPVHLHTPNGLHLRFAEEKLMTRLFEAGFRTLRFGFESSASKHTRDTCGKVARKEVRERIAVIKKCGFNSADIGIYTMAGLPEQTPDDVLDEMEFIGSLDVQVKPVFLSPVPSTPLYNRYLPQFPSLATDPLWHNDAFFITQLEGWDTDKVEMIRLKARAINADHCGSGFAADRTSFTRVARTFSKN